MAKLSVDLWKALHQLKDDEFKKFKWFLKQDDIPAAQLEKADRQDTVDLMAQKYGSDGAMKETMTVLEKISRNDLVHGLQNSCPEPKDVRPLHINEDYERKKAELNGVQQFAAAVTLDPDRTQPDPVRSGGPEEVHCADARRKPLTSPERFYRCVCWSAQRIDKGTNQN